MPPPIPRRKWHDWLWPTQNPRWYFTDADGAVLGEERLRRLLKDPADVDETLEQAKEVAQSAVDRTVAADRRATTLGGTVAVAASLTVGGASLVLDRAKVPEQGWRFGFALAFALATLMFAAAGFYAARAIVTFRKWSWVLPYPVLGRHKNAQGDQRLERAAELLHHFAFNWEVADAKIRSVESSFRAFVVALLILVLLALGIAVYQL
ncbi:MAG TPA: hypothetical protein VN522_02885 [Solirubrobacterales bacterium]|nr:hypothetical protein [Solirubrobacterales bacterium]